MFASLFTKTLNTVQQITIWAIPVLFAITVHETAHGWMAWKLGDDTAKRLGRISLNPIHHIDLIGTIILPVAMLLLTGFMFGWAKPVPVNWRNLKQARRDSALVALAGPTANLLMVILWAIIAKIALSVNANSLNFFVYMASAGIFFNLILMTLNLVPILPLDGGRILYSLLPPNVGRVFAKSEPFGLFILIALLFSGLLGALIMPIILFGYLIVGGMPEVLQILFA